MSLRLNLGIPMAVLHLICGLPGAGKTTLS